MLTASDALARRAADADAARAQLQQLSSALSGRYSGVVARRRRCSRGGGRRRRAAAAVLLAALRLKRLARGRRLLGLCVYPSRGGSGGVRLAPDALSPVGAIGRRSRRRPPRSRPPSPRLGPSSSALPRPGPPPPPPRRRGAAALVRACAAPVLRRRRRRRARGRRGWALRRAVDRLRSRRWRARFTNHGANRRGGSRGAGGSDGGSAWSSARARRPTRSVLSSRRATCRALEGRV